MQNKNTSLDQLNFRSLRVLKHLLESKSVSLTASYIGLSQPATSRILANLREVLGDPLLVRAGGGYGLTDYAEQLYPRLMLALESINLFLESEEFVAENSNSTVRIASTDYGLIVVLRDLYKILLKKAPGIRIEIINFTPNVFSLIEQGEIDLALFANFNLPGDFHYRILFEDNYSILVRKNHPLTKLTKKNGELNNAQLNEWPRAELLYPGMDSMQHDDIISSITILDDKNCRFSLPYFLATATLVESTDTIAALPTRMCKHAELHYEVTTLPLDQSNEFSYVAIWHHRQHQRPLLRWLLAQLNAQRA